MRAPFQPLVSIITPVYNHERFIRECIESVLRQSYPCWEQIVVDDGSTDRTAALVSEYSNPRIRYHRQRHKGVFRLAETYNRALGLAKGELIGILEGDDIWPADRLASLVPAFQDREVVVSYGICRGFGSDGAPVRLVIPAPELRLTYGSAALRNDPPGAITYAMLHSQGMVASAVGALLRRATLEAIGGFQQTPDLPVADYPTLLELGLKGRFFFTNQVTYLWRKHPNNVTTVNREAVVRGIHRCALAFLEKHRHDGTLSRKAQKELERRLARSEGRFIFLEGRRLLRAKAWKEARVRFRAAFRAPTPDICAAALCGYVASCLHGDIEWLMRLAGRAEPGKQGCADSADRTAALAAELPSKSSVIPVR